MTAVLPPLPLHHFIVTNFNVRLTNRAVDLSGVPVLTTSWLADRIDLFETFCLPSIAGQTCQAFEWLVRFGVDTPPHLRERVAGWRRLVNLTPIWPDTSMMATIASRVRSHPAIVVTTRLDNDDGLHEEFVATVQGEVNARRPEVLCPTWGYSLQYPDGELRLIQDPLAAFITLVDPVAVAPTRTVFSAQHRDAASLAPLRQIGSIPLWLRVCHGRNLWNRPKGDLCTADGVRKAFHLKPDVLLKGLNTAHHDR